MKFNKENVSSSVVLYSFIGFIIYHVVADLKYCLLNYNPLKDELINKNIFSLEVFILFNVLTLLISVIFLFPHNNFIEEKFKIKFSPWHKIAILITFLNFLNFFYISLFSMPLKNEFRDLSLYNYNYIISILRLIVCFLIIPGFFFDKYRKFFYVNNRTELFILLIGVGTVLDVILNFLSFFFISVIFEIFSIIAIFFVLLPYSNLSKYLKRLYRLNSTIKLKITIFLYFLVSGIITVENGFALVNGTILISLSALALISLSYWISTRFLKQDFSLVKKIFSLSFVSMLLILFYKIICSYNECQLNTTNYYITDATLRNMAIIEHEIENEIAYFSKYLPSDKSMSNKISLANIDKESQFLILHTKLMNEFINNLTNIPERQLKLFYEIDELFSQRCLNLVDAYNYLKLFKETSKNEYWYNYQIYINKDDVTEMPLYPKVVELQRLHKKDERNNVLTRTIRDYLNSSNGKG